MNQRLCIAVIAFLFLCCGDSADDTTECNPADTACNEEGGDGVNAPGGLPGLPACGNLFICVENCAGEPQCESECTNGLESFVMTYHGQLQSCLYANGCAKAGAENQLSAYNACVFAHCPGPYQNCFGPLKQGNGSCGDSLSCMAGCAAGDSACLYQCETDATLSGQGFYFEILACADLNCQGRAGAIWESCANTLCAEEVSACENHVVD